MKPFKRVMTGLSLLLLLLPACRPVKPYERIYLKDTEMKLGRKDVERFDENTHSYREGATGGGTGKASGGCGCN